MLNLLLRPVQFSGLKNRVDFFSILSFQRFFKSFFELADLSLINHFIAQKRWNLFLIVWDHIF